MEFDYFYTNHKDRKGAGKWLSDIRIRIFSENTRTRKREHSLKDYGS